MPDSRCRKLSAVRSAVRIDASDPTTRATSSPGCNRVPSGFSAMYSHGGLTFSKTRAAASLPLKTPAFFAMTRACPMRSGATTNRVVTSVPPTARPRSSRRAVSTRSSSSVVSPVEPSGVDETIWFLAQSERLLAETEEDGALAAHAALLAGRLDDAPVDHLAPEVAAIDREPEHGLVNLLKLGDGELRRQQLKGDGRVTDLAAEAAHRVVDDFAMVESHLDGQSAHRVPRLLARALALGANLGEGGRNDGDVRDGHHVSAGVASGDDDMTERVELLRPVERLELLDPAAVGAGHISLLPASLGIQRDAPAAKRPGQRPEAPVRRFGALREQHAQLPSHEGEDREVKGNRAARLLETVRGETPLHNALRHPMLHLISFRSDSGSAVFPGHNSGFRSWLFAIHARRERPRAPRAPPCRRGGCAAGGRPGPEPPRARAPTIPLPVQRAMSSRAAGSGRPVLAGRSGRASPRGRSPSAHHPGTRARRRWGCAAGRRAWRLHGRSSPIARAWLRARRSARPGKHGRHGRPPQCSGKAPARELVRAGWRSRS